jgi:hypothetical protein
VAQAGVPLFECERQKAVFLLQKARCNGAPDCLGGDTIGQSWAHVICNSLAFVAPDPRRTVEIWSVDGKKKFTTVTGSWRRPRMLERCPGLKPDPEPAPGSAARDAPFTIDVPGLSDIIKWPELFSPHLRKERFDRFQSRNSPVPKSLQWIPPLLTKLDNAQDLLFTGLALLIPILRRLPRAFMGPLGVILTINDLLNMLT